MPTEARSPLAFQWYKLAANLIIVSQVFWDGSALEMASSQDLPNLILRVLAADSEITAALIYTYANLAKKNCCSFAVGLEVAQPTAASYGINLDGAILFAE